MAKVITIPVTAFTSLDIALHKINEEVADKDLTIRHIGYCKSSLLKGEIEILVNPLQIERCERPSKFKQNATSQYYCVYKKGNGWTYKFVNKKINVKPFLGKIYDDELDAALAYDKHRFSVEGDVSKLNFPEHYVEG